MTFSVHMNDDAERELNQLATESGQPVGELIRQGLGFLFAYHEVLKRGHTIAELDAAGTPVTEIVVKKLL